MIPRPKEKKPNLKKKQQILRPNNGQKIMGIIDF